MVDKQPRDGEGNFTERVKKSPKHLSEVVVVCFVNLTQLKSSRKRNLN